jgi:hypothetical protein
MARKRLEALTEEPDDRAQAALRNLLGMGQAVNVTCWRSHPVIETYEAIAVYLTAPFVTWSDKTEGRVNSMSFGIHQGHS